MMIGIVYLIGSFVVGLLLIADNVILIRKHGVADIENDGKAAGLTRFFMLVEAGWIGASVMALTMGITPPLVPVLHLTYSAIALILGAISNAAEGQVRSFKMGVLKAFLGLGCIFTLVTVCQLAPSLGR